MARRTKKDAVETRDKILLSALDVLYERGYSNTKLVDVAERLGLTKGAVYWHFESKLDLFLTLIRVMYERIEQPLMGRAMKVSSLEDLQKFFYSYAELYEEDEMLKKFMVVLVLRIEWTAEFKQATDFLEKQNEELVAFCVGIMRRAQKRGVMQSSLDRSLN